MKEKNSGTEELMECELVHNSLIGKAYMWLNVEIETVFTPACRI
jgi:hypothetical protein